jgi:hypothetical protein
LSAFLSVTLLILAYGKENSQSPSYILKVRIDPSSHRIEGRAVIKHPPSRCFYLNNNLEISRVIVDGHPVSFHRQTSEYLPYTVGAAVVIDANSGGELLVEYAGTLTGVAKFLTLSSLLFMLAGTRCFRAISCLIFKWMPTCLQDFLRPATGF